MSRDPSSDLTLVVAAPSTVVSLTGVLRDWSALGLLRPIHLLDVARMRSADTHLPCLIVEQGTVRSVSLQNDLAERTRTTRVRVCVVGELLDTFDSPTPDQALGVMTALTAALPSVDPVRLHLTGTAAPTPAAPDELAWLGWHNLLLAPENAQVPTSGISPVTASAGDPVRINHLAGSMVSICGGWAAQVEGPFDSRPLPPGRVLVAVRTFSRHLTAASLGSDLLARLTNVDQGYPVPLVEGASAWVVEDEMAAARDMADALMVKHAHVLPRPRSEPPARPRQQIGAMAALRMFFAFLVGTLRNAPKAFMEAAVRKVSVAAASGVGNLVFGERDSEFVVVVNGYRPDGTPASWSDVDNALEGALARLGGGGSADAETAAEDLSDLWRDFVSGGLTLLDAAARVPELPPRTLGTRRGVVTTAARIAPDPSDVYRPTEALTTYIAQRDVPAYDLVGVATLDRQLEELAAAQPHMTGHAANARNDLAEWSADRRRCYTGRVGWHLAKGVAQVRSEIASLSARLRAVELAAEVPADVENQQLSLAQRLWIFLGAALLAVVVCILLVVGPLTVAFLALSLPIIVVVWLVSSVVAFWRGQRELFALLHQREQQASALLLLRRHLAEAYDDMRRLSRAYRQYLDWSKGFGRFVQAPTGRNPATQRAEPLPGGGFPLNHRFGAVRPSPEVVEEATAQLSRDLFGVGWLSDCWAAFLADAPAEMGPQRFLVQESPDRLLADPGLARQSLLTTWADAVVDRHQWVDATKTLRASLDGMLAAPDQGATARLFDEIETRTSGGTVERLTRGSFVNSLDRAQTEPGSSFSRSLFAMTASGEPWRVIDTAVEQSTVDLATTLVVTQTSAGFGVTDLAAGSGPNESQAPVHPSAPQRPVM